MSYRVSANVVAFEKDDAGNAGSNVVVDSSAAAGAPGATVYISYSPV